MTELIYAIPAALAVLAAWDGWRRYVAFRAHEGHKDIADLREVVADHATAIAQMKSASIARLGRSQGHGRIGRAG